jgi:hypothetical protein
VTAFTDLVGLVDYAVVYQAGPMQEYTLMVSSPCRALVVATRPQALWVV